MVLFHPHDALSNIPQTLLFSLSCQFKLEGVQRILRPLLPLKFWDCTVIGKVDLRRDVFLGTLLEILSALLGLA